MGAVAVGELLKLYRERRLLRLFKVVMRRELILYLVILLLKLTLDIYYRRL